MKSIEVHGLFFLWVGVGWCIVIPCYSMLFHVVPRNLVGKFRKKNVSLLGFSRAASNSTDGMKL